MNPDNRSQSGGALDPQAPQAGASQPQPTTQPSQSQDAVTAMLRTKIDALYEQKAVSGDQAAQAQPATDSTYDRVHQPHPQPQADQWKAYHSAWQDYYQKYYAAYYAQQPNSQPATSAEAEPTTTPESHGYFAASATRRPTENTEAEDVSKDEALFELRQKLLGKVRSRAKKIRRSRHFLPIAAAFAVVLVFVFLQYNRVIMASVNAYVSPGSINPQNIVIDPTADNIVSPEPRLVIPKINVDVPVIYDISPDHTSQMSAMQKGVAHFAIPGANSHPGEIGNTVLSGHSSNDLFDVGDYKFIFAQLEKLKTGDTIYANYEGKRYTYVVTKTETVKPSNVAALIYPTDKPVMTLITCTPLGTALNRFLVTAEQVSPDPGSASAAPAGSGEVSDDEPAIPGNSPTLLERLFGAR